MKEYILKSSSGLKNWLKKINEQKSNVNLTKIKQILLSFSFED